MNKNSKIVERERERDYLQAENLQDTLNKKETQRQSNFELLRIIAMILIVMHHWAVDSGFNITGNITLNRCIIQFFSIGGKVGVNVFVLITGYFMVNSRFKLKKLINIIIQTFTYSIIFLILNIKSASLMQIIISVLPVTLSQYWFITTYIFLYMLSPFINKLLQNLDKKEHEKLLIMLLVVQCVLHTLVYAHSQFSNIAWFIVLYILGAYISKYCNKENISMKKDFTIAIISYLVIFASTIILEMLSAKFTFLVDKTRYFAQMYSIFTVITSVFLFCGFSKIKFQNTIVNSIAGTTFGIYIIHENTFMRNIIWLDIVQGAKYTNSPYLIINAIVGVISVFVVCAIIEKIRQITIERLQNKVVDKIIDKVVYKSSN